MDTQEDFKMIDAFMQLMSEELTNQDTDPPKVGIFWWSSDLGCFGVDYSYADNVPFESSNLFSQKVKRSRKLHQQQWKKLKVIGKWPREYSMIRYDMIPRGRVFQLEDGTFVVMHGHWLEEYPEAKEQIISEFDLPVDKTVFKYYEHWDIGHNWNEVMA